MRRRAYRTSATVWRWSQVLVVSVLASLGLASRSSSAAAQTFAYVLEPEGAATVDAVNLSTHAVKIIVVGTFAWTSTVSPNHALFLVRSAYESTMGAPPAFQVAVIDTARRYVRSSLAVHNAGGVAAAPSGPLAYVTDCNPNGVVSILNLNTGALVGEIALDVNPQNIWLTPNGALAYVTSGGYCPGPGSTDNSLAVVDTTMRKQIATISLGGAPGTVTIAPSGDVVYATRTVYPDRTGISVINTATNEVIGDVPVSNPTDMAVTPDGAHLYVVNFPGGESSSKVSVIDTATKQAVGTIAFPPSDTPVALAIHPSGRRAYVTHRNATGAYIAEVDTGTYAVVDNIPIPYAGSIAIVNTCPGDCDADGQVTVDEIMRSVNIALGKTPLQTCPTVDASGDGAVAVDEIERAVQIALDGCASPPPRPVMPRS